MNRALVAREVRRGLPREDLAQPPTIADRAGESDRLGETFAGQFGIRAIAGDRAGGGERTRQQGRVVKLAGDRQRLLSLIDGVDGAHPDAECCRISQRPRPHCSRHLGVRRVVARRAAVEPREPFPDTAPREPQR